MYKENLPNAGKLIESLRHLGYNNYSAICDLVDNSFDAEASTVSIEIEVVSGEILITIADDGIGMNEKTLDQALKLGSLTDRAIQSDLGKFGMGLVTASLSIAKKTSILTKGSSGEVWKSYTDVDEIKKRNEFCKFFAKANSQEVDEFERQMKKLFLRSAKAKGVVVGSATGTIVEISKCDNLKSQPQSIPSFKNTLKNKLGQIYRFYLLSGKKIFLNGELVEPRDPLMFEDGPELYSDETFEVKLKDSAGVEVSDQIRLRIVVLPDFGDGGNRERKINQQGQGFYILRNNREIADGATLGIYTRHNDLNRFRAEIFFSGVLDEFMGVNFTKHRVDPSQSILDKIKELTLGQLRTIRSRIKAERATFESGDITHTESEKVITAKGNLLVKPKQNDRVAKAASENGRQKSKPSKDGKQVETDPTPAPKLDVKFEAERRGVTGLIYEAEQVGKLTIIRWNIDHPFYQRFVLEHKDDPTLLTSVDFLVYSLATAELTALNDENYDIIQNIRAILSLNLRVLLG